jgi:flagellar biosynthetic protein FliP
MTRSLLKAGLLLGLLALAPLASAAGAPGDAVLEAFGRRDTTPMLQAFLFLTALSFLPLMVIGLTSFTRIIVVLSLVRQGLGLQQTPPNSVLMVLALFLTFFTMAPVLDEAYAKAYAPFERKEITQAQALERGFEPFKAFMIRQTRREDMALMAELAKTPLPATEAEVRPSQLIPAFLLSELKTAFTIGFVLFLPFLLVDLVVAAILMALGMIMVPPSVVSLPLKILVFLLIDGWGLVIRAVLSSYG